VVAQRIGILTGGGDVPGLNSVIKSVVYNATEIGCDVIGIRKGWEGLTHMRRGPEMDGDYIRRLDRNNTRTIDRTGGTWLHTSRTNPSKMRADRLPPSLSIADAALSTVIACSRSAWAARRCPRPASPPSSGPVITGTSQAARRRKSLTRALPEDHPRSMRRIATRRPTG
jgi:hypothetical protein